MDIFKNLKTVVKRREVVVDNEVFQLHYRVTALLLIGCAALVASKQHFGDPIECITKDDVPNKIMDTYCWIHATFTLPDSCNKSVGIEVAHPCVDKFVHPGERRVYHKYYQWVYFVLFFQAMCFYAPHFLWKMWESKLLLNLTQNLKNPLCKEEDYQKEVAKLVQYLARNRDLKRHKTYLYYFLACELMNFINVLMQIYLVDEFLGGTFTTYGLDVINYVQLEQDVRIDPMVRIFPRMTKCTFHRFGASGDVQKYDAMCILPLNIINEKIYIVMWFWFLFLACVTAVWLLFRLIMLAQPEMRYKYLNRQASLASGPHIRNVLRRLDIGDWFLLSMMCTNMDAQWFRCLMMELDDRLRRLDKKNRNGMIDLARRRKEENEERLVDNEERADNSDSSSEIKSEPSVVIDSGDGTTLKLMVGAGDV